MKLKLAAVAVATGLALTACSGPIEAGSAATVGDHRITTDTLEKNVAEYQKALEAAKVAPDQLQLPGTLTQAVLLQLANISQFTQLEAQNGISVTEGEVAAFYAKNNGQAAVDQILLQRGVAPGATRDWLKVSIGSEKLAAKLGGGSSEQQLADGQAKINELAGQIPVVFSPRYGKFDPQQGWLPNDRFGAPPAGNGAAAG
ncbi:SurA N-terminal domain-containing protein [Herbidospora mongoliensis]|uniref:SurA N-terminal domain-containing protein n=1 Tax=Herbidospora mongoliensis TaxID=688067 RepID=UPI000829F3F3|nr:SurA N-terminal domain-containing protein [Herbidospora mongoliensis]